jgi:uncharacterized protein
MDRTEPADRPEGLTMTDLDPRLLEVVRQRNLGSLATIKRDGRPQLSNVNFAFEADQALLRVSVTDDRAKVRNLRRDPRASVLVSSADGWSYTVLEGDVTFSEVAESPDDAAVEELIEVYRLVAGEHPDWDDYRRAMVQDHRLVLRLQVTHAYGMPPGCPPGPSGGHQPWRVLTSAREGFVAALPSGKTTVGTVWLPPLTLIT